ncbi:unnamed protein product, partial [Mesorhabditis spiculigera]
MTTRRSEAIKLESCSPTSVRSRASQPAFVTFTERKLLTKEERLQEEEQKKATSYERIFEQYSSARLITLSETAIECINEFIDRNHCVFCERRIRVSAKNRMADELEMACIAHLLLQHPESDVTREVIAHKRYILYRRHDPNTLPYPFRLEIPEHWEKVLTCSSCLTEPIKKKTLCDLMIHWKSCLVSANRPKVVVTRNGSTYFRSTAASNPIVDHAMDKKLAKQAILKETDQKLSTSRGLCSLCNTKWKRSQVIPDEVSCLFHLIIAHSDQPEYAMELGEEIQAVDAFPFLDVAASIEATTAAGSVVLRCSKCSFRSRFDGSNFYRHATREHMDRDERWLTGKLGVTKCSFGCTLRHRSESKCISPSEYMLIHLAMSHTLEQPKKTRKRLIKLIDKSPPSTMIDLKRTLKAVTAGKPRVYCGICQEKGYRLSSFLKHLRHHAAPVPESEFRCRRRLEEVKVESQKLEEYSGASSAS